MIFEFLDNKYVSSFLTLMIVLYATFLRPELPPFVKELFNNTLFRMFILFLVVVKGNTNPSLGLVIAIAFILTMDYLYVMDSQEAFRQCEEWEFPESHGCEPFENATDAPRRMCEEWEKPDEDDCVAEEYFENATDAPK